jgi:hypothetical protein
MTMLMVTVREKKMGLQRFAGQVNLKEYWQG